ncbi:hypothetical protein SAMN03159511_1016 [Pseudomonas sp. NFACC19-2]|nr:hypothetical protein [Pseudomonas sp. NFACC19-2]SFW16799.1 hypothetical protein SAMN03159511_1016 [Pseudomonas sp. NFACC19-2]
MNLSNPARRLHEILKKGKAITPDTKCQTAWGNLLSAKPSSPDLLRKLAKIMMLPDQILEIIKNEVPEQLETQKHWSTPVSAAFRHQNLSENWHTFTAHIPEQAIDFLSMTSVVIDMKLPSNDIDEEKLNTLRDKLAELLTEINTEEVPEKVRKYIEISIRKIMLAIDEYHLSGESEIIDAVEAAMGHAFFDKDYRDVMSETEVGKKLFDIFNQISVIVTLSTGLPAIIGSLSTLLPAP